VAAVFRSTAEGETGHAHGHLEYLEAVGDPATGLPIGETSQNLSAAVAGETHEYTDMYPGMARTAAKRALRKSQIGSRHSPRPSAHTPAASKKPSTNCGNSRFGRSKEITAGCYPEIALFLLRKAEAWIAPGAEPRHGFTNGAWPAAST